MITTLCCAVAAVGLHLGSFHLDPYAGAPALNGFNPGAYVEFSNQVVLGTYHNSVSRPSVYLAYNWRLGSLGDNTEFALLTGGITGYPLTRVVPLVVPSVRFALGKNYGLRVAYIPKMPATQAHVVHFAYEFRF